MSRAFYRYRWNEELRRLEEISAEETEKEALSFYVTGDTMPPTEHPADGRTYDSKSAFRRATKEAGCVEIGNDWRTIPGKQGHNPNREIRETLIDLYRNR